MSKRGSGSNSRKSNSYLSGRTAISNMKITGTKKQIDFARDILNRPFEFIERNIKFQKETNLKNAPTKASKERTNRFIEEYKEFGKWLSKNMYEPAVKVPEIKASFIIDNQKQYDGDWLMGQWQRMVKSKK